MTNDDFRYLGETITNLEYLETKLKLKGEVTGKGHWVGEPIHKGTVTKIELLDNIEGYTRLFVTNTNHRAVIDDLMHKTLVWCPVLYSSSKTDGILINTKLVKYAKDYFLKACEYELESGKHIIIEFITEEPFFFNPDTCDGLID